MASHLLVAAVAVDAGTDRDMMARVEQDAGRVDGWVVEALAERDPDRFHALVVVIERTLVPWRANHADARLATYIEAIRRRLFDYAVRSFPDGRFLAQPPTERLSVSPTPFQSGPRSLFGL